MQCRPLNPVSYHNRKVAKNTVPFWEPTPATTIPGADMLRPALKELVLSIRLIPLRSGRRRERTGSVLGLCQHETPVGQKATRESGLFHNLSQPCTRQWLPSRERRESGAEVESVDHGPELESCLGQFLLG